MSTHINDGGTWRQLNQIFVNDSGSWKPLIEVYVNDGGTWRLVFQGDAIDVGDRLAISSAIGAGNAVAVFRLQSDGFTAQTNGSNTVDVGSAWITPQSGMSGYECQATILTGAPSGTFGSRLNLGTTRSWTFSHGALGTATASMTLDIYRVSDGAHMHSCTISFEASNLS